MAGTFNPTGTYSNLTRLELESLRRADFFTNGKALTVGDSGLAPEGVVGVGAVNAEPYYTGPFTVIDEVFAPAFEALPGTAINSTTFSGTDTSPTSVDKVRWWGVDAKYYPGAYTGQALSPTVWIDPAVGSYTGINPGDILVVKTTAAGGGANKYAAAVIDSVAGNTLTVSNLLNDTLGTTLTVDSVGYDYAVLRPNPVQLFAVPGSGPIGQEQSFLFVDAASTQHNQLAPNPTTLEGDRIKNIVPAKYSTADRADGIFRGPNTGGPAGSLRHVGYRVVLYRSNPGGTAADLLGPIASLNPVIDSTIAPSEQRMTIDYQAGVLRFSVAPREGDEIKPVGGGVNPTTGRLQLYAVFFSVDQTTSQGAARSLWASQNTPETAAPLYPAQVYYDSTTGSWKMGTSGVFDSYFSVKDIFAGPTPTNVFDPGKSVEFGAHSPTEFGPFSTFRGFKFHLPFSSPYEVAIKMIRGLYDSSHYPISMRELDVADKTGLTVGDGSMPSKSPGGDFNPAFNNLTSGYQFSAQSIRAALVAGALGGYGTVHLRKGKYLVPKAICVPPGITVEGEGRATQVESFYSNGAHFDWPTVFRFGPNTSWGVYDFNMDEVTSGHAAQTRIYTPQPFDWGVRSLEGLDTVWNPTRRSWGVAYADVTTNTIWFNEIGVDGVALLPNEGIQINTTGNNLFKATAPNSLEYTPAHYPRLAYQAFADEYVVAWVEEKPGGAGPQVHWDIITKTWTDGVLSFSTKFGSSQTFDAGSNTAQPSVAVERNVYSGSYKIAISSTNGYTAGSPNMSGRARIFDNLGNVIASQDLGLSTCVITSTDVSDDGEGNFLFAFSAHHHKLIHGTTGTLTNATDVQLTDIAIANFGTLGVTHGTRILLVDPTAADRGVRGMVAAQAGSFLVIKWDNNENVAAVAGSLNYYLVPRSTVYTMAYINGSLVNNTKAAVGRGGDPTSIPAFAFSNIYFNDVREPDFVRLSHGDGGWILVYQTFDTNASLARTSIKNWDGGINTQLKDQTGGLAQSKIPHRMHLGTSFVLIDRRGQVKGPGAQALGGQQNTSHTGLSTTATNNNFYLRAAMDASSTSRALGGRVLALPNNNSISHPMVKGEYLEMEVGCRFYSLPWSSTRRTSLIPDVTWTGEDWVVVSPSVNRIESDTGTYLFDGVNYYISDPTMIWGANTFQDTGVDGTPLPNTAPGTPTLIYFPSVNQYALLNFNGPNTSSEHVMTLSGPIPGLVIGQTYSWRLVAGGFGPVSTNTIGVSNGIKNAGFRVNSRGQVIVSTNFFTFADEPTDEFNSIVSNTVQSYYRRSEVLYRDHFFGDDVYPDVDGDGDGNLDKWNRFGTDYANATPSNTKHNWNDLFEGHRLKFDLHYRGVAVGAPKGFSEALPDEYPMVALAWGDNFYGFLDRVVAGSANAPGQVLRNYTHFYRQSFGPWNAGLKNMAVKSGPNYKFRPLTREHVFTRHGWARSSMPYFATDGYRNCFVHMATNGFFDVSGTPGRGRLHPLLDYTYRGGPMAVYTDAIGQEQVRVRGGIVQGPLSSEPSDTQWQFSSNVDWLLPAQAQAPKVIWDGSNFVSFVATLVVHGPHDPENSGSSAWYGTSSPSQQPRVYGCIQMMRFPGDEATRLIDDSLSGGSITAEVNTTGKSQLARQGSPQVVASAIVSCGLNSDSDAREAVLFDVAFSGKVFCVVWVMSLTQAFDDNFEAATGGSMIGYALFPVGVDGPGDQTFADERFPVKGFGVPVYTIDVTGSATPGYNIKQRINYPKVIWDGKQFVVTFAHFDNSTTFPSFANKRQNIKCVTIPEDGYGTKPQLKGLAADNVIRNPGGTVEMKLGAIASGVFTLDQTQSPPQPGDLLVITKDATGGFNNLGTYAIVDYDPRSRVVYAGVTWTTTTAVYGHIQSGGIAAGSAALATNSQVTGVVGSSFDTNSTSSAFAIGQPTQAGIAAPATGLGSHAKIIQVGGATATGTTYAFPNDVSRILGLEFDWKTGEYFVIYYENNFDDLYMTSFTLPTGRCREPVYIWYSTTNQAVSFAFNGDSFLVVSALYDWLTIIQVSRDFVVTSFDQYSTEPGCFEWDDTDFIGGTTGLQPGPQYGASNWFAQCDGVHAVWNDKLNRWVVSVSWLSQIDTWVENYNYLLWGAATGVSMGSVSAVSWSGRTVTFTGNSFDISNGCRHLVVYEQPITSGNSSIFNTSRVNLQDISKNFTSLGLLIGDWFQANPGTTESRRWVTNVAPSGGGSSTFNFTYPMLSSGGPGNYIFDGTSYTLFRPQLKFWWNVKNVISYNPNTTFTIDTDSSEANNPGFINSNLSDMALYLMPREDVFLFTFTPGNPAVEVLDADGVSLDNVFFSGVSDVSERYLNMARQVYKSSGPEIGEVTAGNTNKGTPLRYIRRPKVGIQLSTPAGKVETLTMTNVRSTALSRYGWKPTPGLPFHDREISNSVARRK